MIDLRPQPVGIYAPPVANLLLPPLREPDGSSQDSLQRLLRGDADQELPAEWRFFGAAAQGDTERAMQLLPEPESPLSIYNRFVLRPDADHYEAARAALTGELVEMLEVAAYAAGIRDDVAGDFQLDGELLALALATSAAADLELTNTKPAAAKLQRAIVAADEASPILAAVLSGQYADLMLSTPGVVPTLAIQQYLEAIRRADGAVLPNLLADLHMKLGMAYQNAAHGQRGHLLEAVNAYQVALHSGISEESHPEAFAEIQNNLGLAYLSIPAPESSGQLRTGIAVQSFRHALRIYDPETHPDRWASVSMNLANALQYAPSSHPEENLIQAVELYENVLQVRSRAKDPVAYALTLLNQANALAHLGIFKPALVKLAESYKLFHWYDMVDQANTARELVDQINECMGAENQPAEMTTG